jgi:hypothetical protein
MFVTADMNLKTEFLKARHKSSLLKYFFKQNFLAYHVKFY